MSLVVYNGSPRGIKSNSTIITEWFLEGYGKDSATVYYLNKVKQQDMMLNAITEFDQILMVFPLYVDGMPGQVKRFFEGLGAIKEQLKDKEITYIIHSGFSEAIQNRALEKYLNRISQILGVKNHGVIVIPGSEGFRMMPPNMTAKKQQAVSRLAGQFKEQAPYSPVDLLKLSGKERMSVATVILGKMLVPLGVLNFYWNGILKRNDAYKKRFDTPYWENEAPIVSEGALVIRQS